MPSYFSRRAARAVAACALAVASHAANGQPCRVLDPGFTEFSGHECRNGLAHGHGYATGESSYLGEFFEGRRHGNGEAVFRNGVRYDGQWEHGRWNGRGKLSFPDGSYYEGGFRNGEKNGRGTYRWPSGTSYEGEWKDNARLNGVETTASGKTTTYANGAIVAAPAAPASVDRTQAAHQACTSQADSCETACAVGSLAGVLLSRGKGDGNQANAECAARCETAKQACLGNAPAANSAPASPSASSAPPSAPPAAYVGPDMTKCFVVRHSGNDAEIIDRCEGRNRYVTKRIAYCLTGPLHAKVRHKECGGPAFAKWIDWAPSGESHSLGLPTFDFSSTLVLAYGARVELFGCHSPYWPTDVRWDGRRLTATCAKCGRFAADGKATCLKFED